MDEHATAPGDAWRVPAQESALLHLYLSDRDVPCPNCGYNLRQLTGTICPECGDELALRVASLDPKQAAPIAGLIALSAGAGMNGLLLIYAAILRFVRGGAGYVPMRFILVNAGGFVVLGALVVIWVRLWPRIRRLDTRRRWLLVFACGLVTLANLVVFSKVI